MEEWNDSSENSDCLFVHMLAPLESQRPPLGIAMLVVLTRPQADLYRRLLRLTRGAAVAYRGCLGRERGMRTAVSGTLASLVALDIVGILSHGRGRCREIRLLRMPDHIIEAPNPPAKGHLLRTIAAWRGGGLDDVAVCARLSHRKAANDDAAMAVG